MNIDRWLLPEGSEDLLPPQAKRVERVRRHLLDLFELWGYEYVMPPMFEYIESLLTGAGEELVKLDDGYVLPKRLNVKQVGPGRELRDATLVRCTERVRHELCLPAVPLEGWEHKRSIQRQRECKLGAHAAGKPLHAATSRNLEQLQ